ncbi:MAG: putative oxidoreductase YxjF [bacterium]|nr:MAG: putative oxidoreductase YxjF [bacterium]
MLNKKVALVTGGGRGIGRAAAALIARRSAHVIVCARTASQLDETRRIILDQGGSVRSYTCDLGEEKQVADMFSEVKKEFGRLDILVNNAGLYSYSLVENTALEDFINTFRINCAGAFLCCREAFPLMKENGGSIVNVSSLSGVKGAEKFPGFASYAVSKFGVIGLTEVLAVEGKEYGIRVNAVCPGAVDTEMLEQAAPNLYPRLTPRQVAETILFLASPASSGITGAAVELYSHLLEPE